MIDRGHALPLIAQARQLGISRCSLYHLPRPLVDADLTIMRRIDELYLLYLLAGSRMLHDLLRQEGTPVGWLHVATLMKRMGLGAPYRRPNTSKPTPGYKVYPYLLHKLAVTSTGVASMPMKIVDRLRIRIQGSEAESFQPRSRSRVPKAVLQIVVCKPVPNFPPA